METTYYISPNYMTYVGKINVRFFRSCLNLNAYFFLVLSLVIWHRCHSEKYQLGFV